MTALVSTRAASTTKPLLAFSRAVIRLPGEPDGGELSVPSWTVREGECWLVGGSPGSGKSTLLAAAAGVWPLADGTLTQRADGDEGSGVPLAGLVFDRSGRLFREMTIRQNIAMAADYHGLKSEGDPVGLILEEFGLAGVQDKYPADLHRSQHVRVALARALAIRPKVLLLDDPLASADSLSKTWWLGVLDRLQHDAVRGCVRPLATVVACGDPGVWRGMADHYGWVAEDGFREISKDTGPGLRPEQGLQEWLEAANVSFNTRHG